MGPLLAGVRTPGNRVVPVDGGGNLCDLFGLASGPGAPGGEGMAWAAPATAGPAPMTISAYAWRQGGNRWMVTWRQLVADACSQWRRLEAAMEAFGGPYGPPDQAEMRCSAGSRPVWRSQ